MSRSRIPRSVLDRFPQSIRRDSLILSRRIGHTRLRLLPLEEASRRSAARNRARGDWIQAGEELRHTAVYRAMLNEAA